MVEVKRDRFGYVPLNINMPMHAVTNNFGADVFLNTPGTPGYNQPQRKRNVPL